MTKNQKPIVDVFGEIIGLIISPKTSAAEAEGQLSKYFGFGRLCSASVIVWTLQYVSHYHLAQANPKEIAQKRLYFFSPVFKDQKQFFKKLFS